MKLKIYNLAAMAFIGMMACSTFSYAQQAQTPVASATPALPTTPGFSAIPPVAIQGQTYSATAPIAASGQGTLFFTPQPYEAMAGMEALGSLNMAMPFAQGDTIYAKKMQKLREQMNELQKQMGQLRSEEMKKNNQAMQERMKKLNTDMQLRFKDMNKKFELNFKDFGSKMRFNYERNDSMLEKKVQSGEIKLKSKNYTKSYTVDGNDKLEIDNRYGKVTVNTWPKNEFKVDVQIKAYGDDDTSAQKLLDQTTISDSKENNLVAFKTLIDDNKNNGNTIWGTWTSNGKTSVRKVVINYVVYMPVKSALSIANRYGNVVLPDLEGIITINNSYGGLVAKALNNGGNTVNVRYGNASIGSFSGTGLDVAYGDVSVDAADKLNADVRYGSVKIGKLSTSGNINVRYGNGLQIADLDKNLKVLSVNSSFAPVKVATAGGTNADFDVTVHLGSFLYGDGAVSVTSKTPNDNNYHYSSTQNYKGHVGKGNAEKVITIKSSYGSVKFD